MHNLAYLRMIEKNRTMLAMEMGMDLAQMAKDGCFPVLLNTDVNYKKPGTLGDTLRIEGRLAEVGKVKFFCEFSVFRKKDDMLLVTCRQALALVKMPEGRPQKLPVVWAEKWG